MTRDELKTWLLQYRTLDRNIDRLLEEKAFWLAKATAVTPVWSCMPKTHGGSDKIQGAVEKVIGIEQEINQKIDNLVTLRRQMGDRIASLEDDKLRELMLRYYIDGDTWEEVAEKMGYSDDRWVRRLHDRAINLLTLESPLL